MKALGHETNKTPARVASYVRHGNTVTTAKPIGTVETGSLRRTHNLARQTSPVKEERQDPEAAAAQTWELYSDGGQPQEPTNRSSSARSLE